MDAINLLRYLVALMFVAALAGAALLIKRYGSAPAAFKDGLKDDETTIRMTKLYGLPPPTKAAPTSEEMKRAIDL